MYMILKIRNLYHIMKFILYTNLSFNLEFIFLKISIKYNKNQ